ncbi:glycosyltransferase family 4 protein [Pontibacter arcticus]|uniref:Glycosyltransferase family 1 protein n=1 Tax=Pontibacter arcticus TaxID=2080288 RepID=A0A364RFE0_9BACT|nr:glycosyltransferase family 1 protein [Pontibacter arcticus]RAU82994.1 glycosyltransferase family 1 protein [Pontibacter arcticus]
MNKQKIYINGRFLTQRTTGVQRVAIGLVKALDGILSEDECLSSKYEIILICPSYAIFTMSFNKVKILKRGFLTGHLWEQFELPFYSYNYLLINLCNVSPLTKKNQLAIIHDSAVFAYPAAYSFIFRLWYKINYFVTSRRSKGIITVSEFSKKELAKFLSINADRIEVIYPASAFKSIERVHQRNTAHQKPYVLAVSSLNPQKNVRGIISAFHHLQDININLFVVGGDNTQIFKSIGIIEDLPNVKFLGYVSDERLTDLYQNALCFVYPSFYEGFGLPPLEAMAYGCPVIVSNRASLPEVCGDAALYCNPDEPANIAEAIRKLYKSDELQEELIKNGFEQLKNFCFRKGASSLLSLIKQHTPTA